MMEKYSKPMVTVDQGLAEGVYADSGAGCYKASAYIHQTPGIGRGDYRIQVNGQHHADHTKEAQTLTISFNQFKWNIGWCNYGNNINNQLHISSKPK